MLRRLIHHASCICLVLGMVASLLWCRSWFAADRFERASTASRGSQLHRSTAIIASHCGSLWLADREADEPLLKRDDQPALSCRSAFWQNAICDLPVSEPWTAIHRHGLLAQNYASRLTYIRLPWPIILWLLCIVPIARIAFVILSAFARSIQIQGRCTACGYDLRATPQRCPECGRLPQAPPSK